MAGRLAAERAPGTPTFFDALADVRTGVSYFWNQPDAKTVWSPWNFLEELRVHGHLSAGDCSTVLLLALVWTAVRYAANALVLKPFADWAQLMPQDARKFPESAFKCFAYTFTWSWTCYSIFAHDEFNHIFYDHLEVFRSWKQGMTVAPVLYWMYMTQMALYVHSVYATLFMDIWRKDSVVLLFHHALTMALIGFSYAIRYHEIGVLVLFVHDGTDIILEFTKCQVYLKKRGGKFHKLNDILSTVGFLAFTAAWVLFRLYWMPLKVLHSSGYGGMLLHVRSGMCPFYFFFNGMLWMLQLLHVYWFMFVLNLLYKVATGQMKELDDVREDDVMQRVNQSSNGHSGGDLNYATIKSAHFANDDSRRADSVNANGAAADRYGDRGVPRHGTDNGLQSSPAKKQSKKKD